MNGPDGLYIVHCCKLELIDGAVPRICHPFAGTILSYYYSNSTALHIFVII